MNHFGKCTRSLKLHLSDKEYCDLAELADLEQRPVSEYLRCIVDHHLYGKSQLLNKVTGCGTEGEEMIRGDEGRVLRA